MIEDSLHSCLVPTRWESILFLHAFFRLEGFWRRRKAFRAFSPSSYAVMTNTEPGIGSGTYATELSFAPRIVEHGVRAPICTIIWFFAGALRPFKLHKTCMTHRLESLFGK